MKRLFIKTVNQGGEGLETTGAKIVFGNGSTPLVNVGPEGAVAITETDANICLTEPFVVNAATVIESNPIKLDGNYVIQIGEDVIPLIFKAEDLPHYFNGKNTNKTDIQFAVHDVPSTD